MKSFEFYSPTKIFFGPDKEKEIGRILRSYNARKVLIVIGKNSVIKNGLLGRVISSLESEHIIYLVLKGVRANPTFDLVREGVRLHKENKFDFILAIGGGSVIDTAKCIAVNANHDGDVKNYNLHLEQPTSALPIGVILTISAAGSELSNSCVIQDDETKMKSGFNSDLVRPVFAIENPELTYTVSKEQTAYGIVDILMHTLERYFSPSEENELADEFALGLLKIVLDVGLKAYDNPNNYDYRATLMLASSLSHNGLTSVGKKYYMPVHQLEHPLSGRFVNIAHGAGLAVLFPAWCKYYYKYDIDKFALLAERVFDIYSGDKTTDALSAIAAFEEYFATLGMPKALTELGVKEEDIDDLVSKVTKDGTKTVYHHTKPINDEVARKIYYSCL